MLQTFPKRSLFPVTGLLVLLLMSPSIIKAAYLDIVTHDDTVDVWLMNWEDNCAFGTIGTVTQVADTFNIIWSDTMSNAATCMCWFDLKATMTNLPPGNYWAKTWVGTLMNANFPGLDTVFTGEVQFTIEGSTLRDSVGTSTWQSACHSYQSVDPELVPSTYAIDLSAYPNPFNPTTTIRYTIPENSPVTVTIYDQQGRQVNTLVNAQQTVGDYHLQWNGTDASGRQLSSGLYFCQVQAGGFSKSVKLVLMK